MTKCATISRVWNTVFPPEEESRNNFHWQPEGDRVYGPGTHDIKGGTVMMWLMLQALQHQPHQDRKSTRLNSSHGYISYAVFCLKKKKWASYLYCEAFVRPIDCNRL